MEKDKEEILESLKGTLQGKDIREDDLSEDAKLEQTKSMWETIKQFSNNPTIKEEVEHDGVQLPIRVLGNLEVKEAEGDAKVWWTKLDLPLQDESYLHWRTMINLILKSLCSSPMANDSFPFLSREAIEALPMPSLISLYRKFELVQEKYNIDIEQISTEEFEYMVESVKKNPRFLKELTYSQLLALAMKLCEIQNLLKDM